MKFRKDIIKGLPLKPGETRILRVDNSTYKAILIKPNNSGHDGYAYYCRIIKHLSGSNEYFNSYQTNQQLSFYNWRYE